MGEETPATPEAKKSTGLSIRHQPLSRPLTAQQQSFIRHYSRTGNATVAARKAGYGDPEHYGSRLLARMMKSGITETFVARKIKEGMSATYAPQLYKDGEVKQPVSPDFATRHKYLDTVLKVRGAYAPVKHEVTQKTINIVLNFQAADGLRDSGAITEEEYRDIIDVTPETGGENGKDGDTGGKEAAGTEGAEGADLEGERGDCGGGEAGDGDSGAVPSAGPSEVAGSEPGLQRT